MDPYSLLLGFLVASALAVMARAARTIRRAPPEQELDAEQARARASGLRERVERVRCPRCNGPSLALSGTGRGYRCEGCNLGFVGPDLGLGSGPGGRRAG